MLLFKLQYIFVGLTLIECVNFVNSRESHAIDNGNNQHQNGTRNARPRATSGRDNATLEAMSTRRINPQSSSKQTLKTNSTIANRRNIGNVPKRQFEGEEETYIEGDKRVPFWNIAHMINSIEHIEPALSAGANGIETDISFDGRGFPVEAYHGFPCDCGRHCHYREDLLKFIDHLAQLTLPPSKSRLLIVLFDLKLKELSSSQKEVAGRQLARILHERIYSKYQQAIDSNQHEQRHYSLYNQHHQPLRFVLSINHAVDIVLVKSFIGYMRENRLDFMSKQVGFDVGMNDDLNEISSMWNELNGATFNIWQGDGLTNCANLIRGIDRLKSAISVRNGQGHFRKVYYWTADIMYHIRSVLRLGLDAMLTNQPQRVVQVLQEPEFNVKYRLASPYDDPFAQFWIQPSASQMSLPTLNEAFETVTNLKQTSANFVQTLPDGIRAAIKKVHNSLTSS